MSKMDSYDHFDHFVFRSPTFSVSAAINDIFSSKQFREGLYLASPDLFDLLHENETEFLDNFNEKQRLSFLKYILRSKYRCTPFGLFAGVGLGRIGEYSEIKLVNVDCYKSHTRLDMTYLHSISKHIGDTLELQDELTFYPNDSLHKIEGIGYRYIEYTYLNSERKYFLSEFKSNVEVEKVILSCEFGLKGKAIVELLINEDISEEEARDYLKLLSENQVILPQCEFSAAGDFEVIDRIIHLLESFDVDQSALLSMLQNVKKKMSHLDKMRIGRGVDAYKSIEWDLKKKDISFDRKYLFQSDLSIFPSRAILDKEIVDEVKESLPVLHKFTKKSESSVLKKFKENFILKYEQEEIPLLEALDIDTGVVVGSFKTNSADNNPLIENLRFVNYNSDKLSTSNNYNEFLQSKYLVWLQNDLAEIVITDEDLKVIPDRDSDFPDTISAMIEVGRVGNEDKNSLIRLKGINGTSAANLLGRFCYSHPGINDLVNRIVEVEDSLMDPGSILAEIIHIPQARLGNILYRPNFRKFQISFLTINISEKTENIPVSDIFISIPDGKTIVLRSRKLNKRVVPRLTTAHNFVSYSLPIYHFLCLLQASEKTNGLYFDWAQLTNNLYLPRVRYKNVILSPKKWNIPYENARIIPSADNSEFYEKAMELKETYKIDDRVFLSKNGNKILIDFGDMDSLKILFSEIKKDKIVLEEYIFDHENMLIKDDRGDVFTNEVLLNFFKKKRSI